MKSKIIKKKYILVAFLCAVLLTGFLAAVMPDKVVYGEQHMTVSIDLRVQKDIACKLYYLTEEKDEYAEERVLSKEIIGGEEFQTVSFDMPIEQITGVRFDFGQEPGYVDVKAIHYFNGFEEVYLPMEELVAFECWQIDAASPSDEMVTYYSEQENPYIYSDCDMTFSMNKNDSRRLRYSVINFVVSFILAYILLLSYGEDIKKIYRSRRQIATLAINDFKSRYVGSYLGRVWGIIQPIMTILMFWFVFQVGLRSNPISDVPFILWLIAAMIPWNFFSDAWLSGNSAFTGYSYIVKKVVFNIDILPLVKVLASSILNVVFNVLIIIVYSIYGLFPGFHILDMLYYSFCLTILALGLSMITATLNVFMKDVGQFLNIMIQYLMWFTPIMWMYTMIPESSKLSLIYKLNPLFYVLNGYRESLISGVWFFENYWMMIYYWIVTIVIFTIGTYLMKKMKPHFADVL